MSKRRGDWRDLLTTYALALKPNKIFVGYVAVLYTLLVMAVAVIVYGLAASIGLVHPGRPWVGYPAPGQEGGLAGLYRAWTGGGHHLFRAFLPLLNPFYDASIPHFILSVLTYIALFWAWSGAGGMISRLTALEYARDDLPTLSDARQMVRAKRTAYWLAPVWPLLFLVGLVFLNFLGGLIGSIPFLGRLLLVVPGFPLLFITSVLIVMLLLFGVLSFGLMMPAVSVGGKDALDGWSTSYTYVLWGSARYIGYTALACAVGTASVYVFARLTHLLIYVLTQSVDLGYVLSTSWVNLSGHDVVLHGGAGGYAGVMQYIMGVLLLGIAALPYAYGVSFFFSAFTVIFFLLRKHVDNIEVDEVYEETEEEEEEEFQPEEPLPPSSEEFEEEETEETVPPEVAEEGRPEPSDSAGELPEEPEIDNDKSMED
jgi:hypothetical protein